MKTSSFFRAVALVLFVSLFASCSSDSATPVDNNTIEQHFDFTYADTEYPVINMTCVRGEDYFEAAGYTADNRTIDIVFNKHGKLISASAISTANGWENSFAYNKAEYFTFELVNLDETNKVVEATYSGRVYENEYDFSSPYKLVSGSFKVKYTETTPQVPGIHYDAKINGQDWHGSQSTEGSTDFSYTDISGIADDKYELQLRLPYNTSLLSTGTFSFNESTLYNKMVLNIFDLSLIHI